MQFKCEVKIPRTGEWITFDEMPMPTTRAAYEKSLPRQYPVLRSREWRVIEVDKPPAKELFSLRVPMRRPK